LNLLAIPTGENDERRKFITIFQSAFAYLGNMVQIDINRARLLIGRPNQFPRAFNPLRHWGTSFAYLSEA
jgi:hypothetical protein